MAVTMSDEKFQQLMGNKRTLLQSERTTELPKQNHLLPTGNFAKYNFRFAGNEEEGVEAFIDAILIYKDCVGICDEIAVKGLPMLFIRWRCSSVVARSKDISKLNPTPVLHDSHKLDMIYGLLQNRIRRLLPRGQVNSFRELIKKAQLIEDNILEVKEYQTENGKDKFQRKEVVQKNTIHCYGCNAPGVIRAKCRNCNRTNQGNTAESNLIQFHQINLPGTSSEYMKPLLSVTINGFYGVGIADSGAQVSIAGHELYKLLNQQGQTFTPTKARLSYANGEVKEEDLLKTTVGRNNKILLGVDFLRGAEITLDIANRCWYFSNDTKQKFNFMNEQTSDNDCEIRISSVSLRVDEGEKLSADQRPKLDTLLNENEDMF
ncbi:Myo1A [Trypoxylus dichotomus]